MDKKTLKQMFKGVVPGVSKLLESPEYSKELLLALRNVYAGEKMKGVSITTCTNKPHCINNIFTNYENQFYKKKELIIILNRDDMDINEWKMRASTYPNVSVYQLPEEMSLGECYNFAIDKTSFDYIATFDDDDYYAPFYLNDLMNAFRYTDADIVGKRTYFAYVEDSRVLALRHPGHEYEHIHFIGGGKRIVKRKVFDRVRFPDLSVHEDKMFCRACVKEGFKIFSADRYNLVYLRAANKTLHTSKISDEEMLEKSLVVAYTDTYWPYVTL